MSESFLFFRYPDLDATIGIATNGTTVAITLLAEGCSRKGQPGAYSYTRRNPDRRKAAARLLQELLEYAGCVPMATRGGKASNGPVVCTGHPLTDFRKGGNFRFVLWIYGYGLFASGVESGAQRIGLIPTTNRPVSPTWPPYVPTN